MSKINSIEALKKSLPHYLNTIKTTQENGNTSQKVELECFTDYTDIFNGIHSILSVCQSAINSQDYNVQEHSNIDLAKCLQIAKNLIPHSEAEFLDKLKKDLSEN